MKLMRYELAFAAVLAVLLSFSVMHANAEGLPPSQPRTVCEVTYTLQPGERMVLLCEAPVPRGGLQGIAQIFSGHESVDATLVQQFARGRFVFAVTNRSAAAVTATARGEQW